MPKRFCLSVAFATSIFVSPLLHAQGAAKYKAEADCINELDDSSLPFIDTLAGKTRDQLHQKSYRGFMSYIMAHWSEVKSRIEEEAASGEYATGARELLKYRTAFEQGNKEIPASLRKVFEEDIRGSHVIWDYSDDRFVWVLAANGENFRLRAFLGPVHTPGYSDESHVLTRMAGQDIFINFKVVPGDYADSFVKTPGVNYRSEVATSDMSAASDTVIQATVQTEIRVSASRIFGKDMSDVIDGPDYGSRLDMEKKEGMLPVDTNPAKLVEALRFCDSVVKNPAIKKSIAQTLDLISKK